MNETQVYWWLMLDNIGFFFLLLTVTCIFGLGIIFLIRYDYNNWDYYEEEIKKQFKLTGLILAILFPIFLFATTFIPSSKQYALIKVLPAISNSEIIQKDMPEMYKIAKDYLKEMVQK